jgi:hypothetical protein
MMAHLKQMKHNWLFPGPSFEGEVIDFSYIIFPAFYPEEGNQFKNGLDHR